MIRYRPRESNKDRKGYLTMNGNRDNERYDRQHSTTDRRDYEGLWKIKIETIMKDIPTGIETIMIGTVLAMKLGNISMTII